MKPIKTPVLLLPLALGMAGALMVRCTPDSVVNPAAPVTTGGTSVTNPTPATGTTVTRTNTIWVTNDRYQYLAGYGTSVGPAPNFANPVSIQVVGSGSSKHIYISDSGNSFIFYFTYNGSSTITPGTGVSTGAPQMMGLDASNRLWVTDTTPRIRIWGVSGGGTPVGYNTNILSGGSSIGQVNTGAVMGNGVFVGTTLLLADKGNSRLMSFTNVPYLAPIGNQSNVYPLFNKMTQTFAFVNVSAPTVIREDFYTPGAYLIVDSGNASANNTQNRILSVDANFNLLRILGNPTTTPGILFNPVDIATNTQRQYLVVDRGNHRVVRLNADGYLMEVIGGPLSSSDNGKFFNPYGIATDQDDLMYVVDQGNNRFQVFTNTRATNLVTNITRVWSNF